MNKPFDESQRKLSSGPDFNHISSSVNGLYYNNPNNPYISTSVPFHPLPMPNHYYPSPSLQYRFPYPSLTRGSHNLSNHLISNNFYTSMPMYENNIAENTGSIPYSMPATFEGFSPDSHISQFENSVCDIPTEVDQNLYVSTPMHKTSELQALAQAFVPKNTCIDNNVNENSDMYSNSTSININKSLNINSDRTVNSSGDNHSNLNISKSDTYGNSTRPKEFKKDSFYLKNMHGAKPFDNPEKGKRNIDENHSSEEKSTVIDSRLDVKTTKGDSKSVMSSNYNSLDSQRNQTHQQSRYKMYDENSTYNSRGKFNKPLYPKRQNNYMKREWRRSADSNYTNYGYLEDNYHYNNYNRRGIETHNHFEKIPSNRKGVETYSHYEKMPTNHWQNNKQSYYSGRNKNYIKNNASIEKNLSYRNGSQSYGKTKHLPDTKSETTNNTTNQSDHKTECKGVMAQPLADKEIEKNKYQITFSQDEKLQRENMIDYLTKGIYECMVCCDRIKPQQAIWSCNKCYNCFHLGCIKKWAGASQGEPGWRCPACQNQNSKIPSGYFCFCKKLREPEWNRKEIPHSCGEVCGKKRDNKWCTHKCTILCHPGPCPDCTAFIKRSCHCGKNSKEMRCAQTEPYVCSEKCGRPLECGVHFCEKFCHTEDCGPCSVILQKSN